MDPSFEAGRTTPAETLALELATAPLVFLEGALANPAMQPGLVSILLKNQEHPMVIRALLQNPRLVEEDALVIASARGTPSGVLQTLAEDARFSKRPSVQKALVQNHATPAASALRIVQGLGAQTLKELARAPHVPTLVKVAVQRILDDREHPQGGSSPASGI